MTRSQTIKVGSKVRLRFGGRQVVGTVVEDRGPVGVGGRRLVRVRLEVDGQQIEFELPAADVRAAA